MRAGTPPAPDSNVMGKTSHNRLPKSPSQGVHSAHLVCLLPLSSCWATEAHFSASCVTKRRWRKRSLSGNFFISDSSIKALKLTRPRNKEKITFSVIIMYEILVWNTEGEVRFDQFLPMDICNVLPLINLFFFLWLRVEYFKKCLELPFNVEMFKKQRTPALSKQSKCSSSCGWNHLFLLHFTLHLAGNWWAQRQWPAPTPKQEREESPAERQKGKQMKTLWREAVTFKCNNKSQRLWLELRSNKPAFHRLLI